MMQLYGAPASPFVRKVRVLLEECGRSAAVEMARVVVTPVNSGDIPLAQVPLGKIPALSRDDGPTLYDSRVITRYLDASFGAGLYPDPPRLWDTLTLEATADGMMEAAVLMVYEHRVRPEDARHPPWVEAQWSKVSRALDALEGRWMATLAGPLDIGQIALGCALGYLDFRHADRDWRGPRPQLAAWERTFAARPSMAATLPEG